MKPIGERDIDFTFSRKPKSVPGDLRIAWRLPVTLLVLSHSRGQRASLAKLHLMNDAMRSVSSRATLAEIIAGDVPPVYWRIRVEPALSRCLDFIVGEHQASWTIVSERTGLILTERGKVLAREVSKLPEDVLADERAFLAAHARAVSETFVQGMLAPGKRLL